MLGQDAGCREWNGDCFVLDASSVSPSLALDRAEFCGLDRYHVDSDSSCGGAGFLSRSSSVLGAVVGNHNS